jgi:hypothetical protein
MPSAAPCKLACLTLLLGTAIHANAATTQPSAITLHAKNASARQVFDDLARQCGTVLPTTPNDLFDKSLPPITIDLDRQPFWSAVKRLGEVSGVEPFLNSDDPYPRMQLGVGTGFWEEPHALAGPVVVFVNDISRSATVELAKASHSVERDITIELTAFVEPGLRVVSVSPAPGLVQAIDENGKALTSLPLNDPDGERQPGRRFNSSLADQPGTRVWTWEMMMRLNCPEDAGRKIARLRGQTHVRVATAVQLVEFQDVMKIKGVSKPVGPATLTFRSMMKADIEYVLRIGFRRDKTPAAEWEALGHSIYNGMLSLYDEQGRVVADRCTENGGEYSDTKIEATLRFVREAGVTHPDAGEPHKLVWQAPTAFKDLPIEFELSDLPIPR